MKRAGLALICLLSCMSTVQAAESIVQVINNSDFSAELWMWPKGLRRYLWPIYVPPHTTVDASYQQDEQYWLVGRDDAGRDFPIGWMDIGAEMRRRKRPLEVKTVFETVTREVSAWDPCLGKCVVRTYAFTVHHLVWGMDGFEAFNEPRGDAPEPPRAP